MGLQLKQLVSDHNRCTKISATYLEGVKGSLRLRLVGLGVLSLAPNWARLSLGTGECFIGEMDIASALFKFSLSSQIDIIVSKKH